MADDVLKLLELQCQIYEAFTKFAKQLDRQKYVEVFPLRFNWFNFSAEPCWGLAGGRFQVDLNARDEAMNGTAWSFRIHWKQNGWVVMGDIGYLNLETGEESVESVDGDVDGQEVKTFEEMLVLVKQILPRLLH